MIQLRLAIRGHKNSYYTKSRMFKKFILLFRLFIAVFKY